MQGHVRRVVTGHDRNGRAVVISDGRPPSYASQSGHFRNEVWSTAATPATIDRQTNPDAQQHSLLPPQLGTAFKIVDFPPELGEAMPVSAATDEIIASASTHKPGTHPGMHRTETVDYCLVLDGEIHLVLDDNEVALRQGDVVVQRGTNHAWSNRSKRPCRMAFVMISGRFDPQLAELLCAESAR